MSTSAEHRHLHLVGGGGAGARGGAVAFSRDTLSPVIDADDLAGLMGRVAKGDEDAFAQVYDAVAGHVLGIARRVVRDPAQAEEVTQEVMLEVWRKAARFDATRAGVRTWVMTIAHRRAVDRVRAAQAATDRDIAASTGPLAPTPEYDEVAETVERRDESERVHSALAGLTELQRESIVLAYYGGHTHADVASLLGVPLGTVKTRIRDGLIRLRDGLGVDPNERAMT